MLGGNANGQLGDGTTTNRSTPVDVHTSNSDNSILDNIEQISLGDNHTCALTTAGKVKCWGQGLSGRLGNRQTSDTTTPVDVLASSTGSDLLSGIAAINLGGTHSCALTTDGTSSVGGMEHMDNWAITQRPVFPIQMMFMQVVATVILSIILPPSLWDLATLVL